MTESLIFSLDGRHDLAKEILSEAKYWALSLNTELGVLRNQKFSDGELCIDFTDSVRGKRVYLLSSPNISDEIMKLTLAIDAAKINGASEIIPIIPYFPYARQDRKSSLRSGIGAKVIANMIQNCGATTLITFDLHALQIEGFFNIPILHIEGKDVFSEYIASIATENTILASPDAGGVKRVKKIRDFINKYHGINLNYITMDKTRTKANQIDDMVIIGDVQGKDVIIIDDIVDTFGTADKAVNVLIDNGSKNVSMIATHGVLSGPAIDRISNSKLHELIISNSIKTPINNKIKIVSVAKQISKAMLSINNHTSYENNSLKTE
jgi:ribose-phosphate pyrophosphokinase